MSTLYEQYLNTLKKDHSDITKIDFLYSNGSVAYSITDDVIQDGSTLSVSYQTIGTRRTATLVVDNWQRQYELHPDKIWFGQQIRISKGLVLPDGTEYLLPQGIFYISNPNEVFNPSERTTTLSLVDKWGYLDGTLFGNIPGTYILNVGDDLFAQITHNGSQQFIYLSSLFTAAVSTASCYYKCFQDQRSSGFTQEMVKYATVIDLTVAFGAGLEPTKSQMDGLMSQFANNWLDGTQTVAYDW